MRRRDGETGQFLRYAFASNGELKSGYYASEDRDYITKEETASLIALNESIAKMLRRWLATLEPSHDARRTKDGRRTKDQERTKNQAPRPKD